MLLGYGKCKSKTRIVTFKMIDNSKFSKDVEQQEVLHTSLGSVSWNNHLKKLLEVFTKAEHTARFMSHITS